MTPIPGVGQFMSFFSEQPPALPVPSLWRRSRERGRPKVERTGLPARAALGSGLAVPLIWRVSRMLSFGVGSYDRGHN
jgi:hypothetical protein